MNQLPKAPEQMTENLKSLEDAAVAKAHILMFATRVSAALSAINAGHLGSARSFLMLGNLDYQAAIQALPEL